MADVAMLPVALRDTALTVAELVGGMGPKGFAGFRQQCLTQLDDLHSQLALDGHPPDVIEDAAYAQCALLDEAALRGLQGDDRNAWEHEPLQVTRFSTHDAGEALITRIERRLAQPQPVLPLLAIFGAVLDLGFQGRFALGGAMERAALVQALDARLGAVEVRMEATRLGTRESGLEARRARDLSPVVWVVGACITAALTYLALDRWLAVSAAQLAGA
ncbi:DotU family type IV/VI secretion system protein [Paraburkholderia bonniea]|uniref:DotU family type IV/VI secretion system protein n=1 Tax=Paraburkholderia bonniea TaxID=2152891 RepID=UPI001FE49FD7|nr:DotU/TssL family secretion system protein [Paraburkholderia bonniea]